MLSKIKSGGDELGSFSGSFPIHPITIPGDFFIWSFLSESGTGHHAFWGFRFSVVPLWPEPDLLELQREAQAEYTAGTHFDNTSYWPSNGAADIQLVRFVNYCCDRLQTSSTELLRDVPARLPHLPSTTSTTTIETNSNNSDEHQYDGGRRRSSDANPLFEIPESDLPLFNKLLHIPRGAIERRLIVLNHLSCVLSNDLFPLLDLGLASETWSMASSVRFVKQLLFTDMKYQFCHASVSNWLPNLPRPVIVLQRVHTGAGTGVGAGSSASSPLTSSFSSPDRTPQAPRPNLFLQAFRQLHFIDPAHLCQSDRAWEVRFVGEGANDAGGPYREALSQICQDMTLNMTNQPQPQQQLSPSFRLMVRTPNQVSQVGIHQDKFVPRFATQSSAVSQSHWEFVGKLLGVALRTRATLELAWPSLMWKWLVREPANRADLEAIDVGLVKLLSLLEHPSQHGITRDTFLDMGIVDTFTAQACDGTTVELKPGGSRTPVTWENRREFASLLEQFRLDEFNDALMAVSRGLRSVMDTSTLCLFSWEELELRVCGRVRLDLTLLARHTTYLGGFSPHHPTVLAFWTVLSQLSSEEHSHFLRFVWGRSRLPPASEFSSRFHLQPLGKSSSTSPHGGHGGAGGYFTDHDDYDMYDDEADDEDDGDSVTRPRGSRSAGGRGDQDHLLPEAHTCFFTLSLPRYSSELVMMSKLRYAITHCKEIDSDYIPTAAETADTTDIFSDDEADSGCATM
jgi:hypothetical protein